MMLRHFARFISTPRMSFAASGEFQGEKIKTIALTKKAALRRWGETLVKRLK
jgi:hypothetical protein